MPSTIVAVTHRQFCSEFHSTWFEEFVVVDGPSLTSPHTTLPDERLESGVSQPLLLQSVKRHIDTVCDIIINFCGWLYSVCRCWT